MPAFDGHYYPVLDFPAAIWLKEPSRISRHRRANPEPLPRFPCQSAWMIWNDRALWPAVPKLLDEPSHLPGQDSISSGQDQLTYVQKAIDRDRCSHGADIHHLSNLSQAPVTDSWQPAISMSEAHANLVRCTPLRPIRTCAVKLQPFRQLRRSSSKGCSAPMWTLRTVTTVFACRP
jgi:hypothetical protein